MKTFVQIFTAAISSRCIPLLLLPMLMICSIPTYAQYSFQVVLPPGAGFTQVFGINNAGKVTGGAYHGGTWTNFIYDMKSGEYTYIGSEMGGMDISNSGVTVGGVDGVCAIWDKKGNITTFFSPSWTVDSTCQARGVNSNGKVSGFEIDESGVFTGFIFDPEYDTYEEFLPSLQTIAHAINAQGQNVGSVYLDPDEAYPGSPEGFYGYLRQVNGSVKYFAISQSYPGETWARGISESGLIAGFYTDPDTFDYKSYVTTVSAGTEFEEITLTDDQVLYQKPCNPNVPPSPGPGYVAGTWITASQIRNDGVVVGSCRDWYVNETTQDVIGYGYGFIATPIK